VAKNFRSQQNQPVRDFSALVCVSLTISLSLFATSIHAQVSRIGQDMEEPPLIQFNEAPAFPSPIAIPQLDLNLPPPPEVDPNVCRLIRTKLGNVSLTGYIDPTAKTESTASQNLPRYRQIFLDGAEVVRGKPSGLTPRDQDLLTMSMHQFFKKFVSTHRDYPGVDIRITRATVDCQQLVLSISRDPNEVKRTEEEVKRIEENPVAAFKEIRVLVKTPDATNPEHLTFQAIDFANAKTLWVNSLDMKMAMNVSLNNRTLSFEFGDLLGLGVELKDATMAKGAAIFRVRIERRHAPFGMISWDAPQFEDARARLSNADLKALEGMQFRRN